MNVPSTKYETLAESLQGFWTVETLGERLKIDRTKTIYVVHRLRKLGFVKTTYVVEKRRLYYIALSNRHQGMSYTQKINEASSNPAIQIISSDSYYVHGRIPLYEEALVYALKQKDVRYLIASLAVFRKISDWSLLYHLAKKEKMLPEIVALYEVARMFVKKVRRMPKRFLHQAERKRTPRFQYIIEHFSSDDFKDIEQKWKIYIPLNRADLEEYLR